MENIFFDLKDLGSLGINCRIGKTVRINNPTKVFIGDNCIIDDFTYISGNIKLGDFSHIAPNVTISGSAGSLETGKYCGIGSFSSIHLATSDFIEASLYMPSVPEKDRFGGHAGNVLFGDYIQLGVHTTILPGVKLPDGVATAAQTILRNKKFDPWTLYSGHDAKRILKRDNSKILNRA